MILALDLGANVGWAAWFGPNDTAHGTMVFKNSRFEGGGMRWLRFRQWLTEVAESHGPIEQVYFEEVRRHRGTDAAHAYGGFLAHLTAWCEKMEIPYQGKTVQAIKIHATGKGNANKAAVVAAVQARGFKVETEDEGDAVALMLLVTDKRKAA